jgi:hypothetical protein
MKPTTRSLIEATQAMLDRLRAGLDVEGVLSGLPGDARHFCWSPHKNILVASEEVDELAFLFEVQVGPNLDGLGRVHNVNLDGLGIISSLKGAERGGHGRVGQRERCIEAQFL